MTFRECMDIRHYATQARIRLEQLEDAGVMEHDFEAWDRFTKTWNVVQQFMIEHGLSHC